MALRGAVGVILGVAAAALLLAPVSANADGDGKKSAAAAAEIPKALIADKGSIRNQPQNIPLDGLRTYGCTVDLGSDGSWLVHVWGDYADGRRANDLAIHGWIQLAAIRASQKKALADCNRFMTGVENQVRKTKR
jgi:hypothetical protein